MAGHGLPSCSAPITNEAPKLLDDLGKVPHPVDVDQPGRIPKLDVKFVAKKH